MAYTFTAYWDDINSIMVKNIKPNEIVPELITTDKGFELNIKVKFNKPNSVFVNDKLINSNDEIQKQILFNKEHSNPYIIPWDDVYRHIKRYDEE